MSDQVSGPTAPKAASEQQFKALVDRLVKQAGELLNYPHSSYDPFDVGSAYLRAGMTTLLAGMDRQQFVNYLRDYASAVEKTGAPPPDKMN